MTEKKQLTEEFIAWGRYLSWADQHRKRLYNFFEAEGDAASSGHTARFITYTSQFFASLWVVVEGYNELTLRDNFVDSILRNPLGHADLLRRCRNGVYHFQPDLLASRLGDFLSATQSALAWVYALHSSSSASLALSGTGRHDKRSGGRIARGSRQHSQLAAG
ncbi:MAG: hypothetical protein HS132_15720 [Planctomycetia bacterium]|nr:hypothetical protein [Planctomycetia bacterium]